MCLAIGDILSSCSKSNIISSTLHRGQVYRMELSADEGVSPKNNGDMGRNKYFVVMGQDSSGDAVGFILINSTINNNLPQSIKDLHYPLKANKHNFLKHDSFVNCADLKIISKMKFDNLFTSKSYKGDVDEDDLEYIICTVKSSPNIAPKTLKKFNI